MAREQLRSTGWMQDTLEVFGDAAAHLFFG
jgi:hypothetical protein